jgi:hypothetical protein
MAAPGQENAPADGPWAAELRERFGDDTEGFAKADAYMREQVQPRITQLEDSPAQKLYKDLQSEENVDLAVASIIKSVYGDEVLEKHLALLQEDPNATVEEAVEAVEEEAAEATEEKPDPRLEWAQNQMEKEAKEEGEREYQAQLTQIIAEPEFKLKESDRKLLAPFMAQAETVGEAVTAFHAFKAEFAAANDGEAPTEEEAEEAAPAPPTLGSAGAPAAVPPQQRKQVGWDDIGDELLAYQREMAAKKTGAAPPTL